VHELSLCRSIAGIVGDHAAGHSVERVRVRIGALRQVVPETLVYCWGVLNEGTELAGSTLEVDQVPAAIDCTACGAHTHLSLPVLRCGRCNSSDVVLVSGEEFLVTSLDLTEA